MVLGKHNVRVHVLAGRIAAALGNAIVAPTIAYVPEGSIHPPGRAHEVRRHDTRSPTRVFEGLARGHRRSFKQHGFKDVVFLGDHGGYQSRPREVSDKLDESGPRIVLPRPRRCPSTTARHPDRLRAGAEGARRGRIELGSHAGLAEHLR